GANALTDHQRKGAASGSHGCHKNRPETENARFINGFARGFAVVALGLDGKIDHEDAVFLDNADEEDDADNGDHAEVEARHDQENGGSDAGGRQGGKDGERVDVAFVKDAQDNIDGGQSGGDEPGFVGDRRLEGLESPGEFAMNCGGKAQPLLHRNDGVAGLAEADARSEVKGDGRGWELAIMIDGSGGGVG